MKQRYFKVEPVVSKAPQPPEETLFVSDESEDEELERAPIISQAPALSQSRMVMPPATQMNKKAEIPASNTPAKLESISPSRDSSMDSFELFESQVSSAIGSIPSRTARYLYTKYFNQPNYIRLALNEYLLGIDPTSIDVLLNDIPDVDAEPSSQIENLLQRMHSHQGQKPNDCEWQRFLGSVDVQAWATRPTMKPLQYADKLVLKRLIPRNSSMNNSSIVRLCTMPQNSNDTGREIGRIPEDLTRIFSPLFDLNIAAFEATILETTKRRLSTGDSFIIQIDIFLKETAFRLSNLDSDLPGDLQSIKRQKTLALKTGFNFAAETNGEAVLRLRQFALSQLFERLSIKPTKTIENTIPSQESTPIEDTSGAICLDSDSEVDTDAPSVKPLDHVNLDQLKEFYQANNQSELMNSLPQTTRPPQSNFKLELRPYQKHGLSWMLTREKEMSVLESLAKENDDADALSTQSRRTIEEREEGVMNPLWRRYKWPKDMSLSASNSQDIHSQEGRYFYANMYNGEMSIEKPMIRTMLKGGIIADEMGLGKTISALALINSVPYDMEYETQRKPNTYASRTTLIVVPMSLLSQWKKEFDKANNNPNHFCQIYYGQLTESNLSTILCNKSKNVPVVLLTTYGTVVNEFTRLNKRRGANGELARVGLYSVDYFRVILDEGHNIRNRTTKTAKSLYEISLQRKWILTGTPIINRLDDLYSLVKFLELDPWCNFSYWKTFVTLPFEQKKISQTLDVIKSILEPIFLRRTKNMKGADGKPLVELPPKEVLIEEIKFNDREEKLYNWFKARANNTFKEGLKSGQLLKQYSQILTHILRLRQICCHMDLVGSAHEMEDDVDLKDDASKDVQNFVDQNIPKPGFTNDTEMRQAMYKLYDKVDLEESECSICTQTPIAIGDLTVTPCGHSYCMTCILEHLDFQKEQNKECLCPLCREPISRYKLFKARNHETSGKEIRFHTREEIEDPSKKFKFQLYLYDPDKCSSKIQALINHLKILKEQNPGEKVIVFSQFSSYLDIIENELKTQNGKDFVIYKFDGRLQMQERQKLLDKFSDENKNADKITILLISLKAGGVGLNLTSASRAFMMDPWWSPSVEDQAIDRIHRIGQNESVKVIRFIIENSIETKMLKIQERKKQIGEAVGAEEEERRKRRIEEIQILFEE
jgi:DNA repair protein RAD5